MNVEGIEIQRGSYGSVKLKLGGKVIYIDPYKIEDPEKADIILITHEHDAHLSLEDIAKVFTQETVVIIPTVAHPPLLQFDQDIFHLVVIGPKEKYFGDGWDVETTPAYSTTGRAHPKGDEQVGYVLSLGGKRVYHSGDTNSIPEMNDLKEIDVAFLPVSGNGVMTVEEAVAAAQAIQPRAAIPIHYTKQEDADLFVKQVTGAVLIQ